jgi:hypothetical protein
VVVACHAWGGRCGRCVTFVFDVPPVLRPAFPRCFVYRAGKKAKQDLEDPFPPSSSPPLPRTNSIIYYSLPRCSPPPLLTHTAHGLFLPSYSLWPLSLSLLRSLGIYTNTDPLPPSRPTHRLDRDTPRQVDISNTITTTHADSTSPFAHRQITTLATTTHNDK